MKTKQILLPALLLLAACGSQPVAQPEAQTQKEATHHVIHLSYVQTNIQKDFDTLYHKQTDSGIYIGFIEQAYATCRDSADTAAAITQDVISSMYLNRSTRQYDCVTTTTFQFPDGTIAANGVFNLVPGSSIAPDHDFPITGGSGAYAHVHGTYTRQYRDSVYHVVLTYDQR